MYTFWIIGCVDLFLLMMRVGVGGGRGGGGCGGSGMGHPVRYWLSTLSEPKLQSTGSMRNAEATCWGWEPAATAAKPPPIE